MNKKNMARLIEHLEKMPESDFHFGHFAYCPEERVVQWGGEFLDTARELFKKTGEVPCGTVACVAGECWLEFAKTKNERRMHASDFAQLFLDIDFHLANQMFGRPWFYGDFYRLSQVKLPHVIKKLKELLRNAK